MIQLLLLQVVYQESNSPFLIKKKREWERVLEKPRSSFKFLAFTWSNPSILIGRPTFFSDLFSALGGKNILEETIKVPYPQVSDEWLLKQSPDIVFFIEYSDEVRTQMQTRLKRWWPKLKPKLVGLRPEFFSRTSFTPLANIDTLGILP